ncbi:hypothetical protein AB0D34_13290 [Streptomyces sp. NPDC048420]
MHGLDPGYCAFGGQDCERLLPEVARRDLNGQLCGRLRHFGCCLGPVVR